MAFRLQAGDIVAVRGTSFVDKSIEDITHSAYSHVALARDSGVLLEAQYGRRVGPVSKWEYKGRADVYRFRGLSGMRCMDIVRCAQKYQGKRYALWLILWELVRYTVGVCVPVWLPTGYRPLVCSTYIADSVNDAGVSFETSKRYPSPADIVSDPRLEYVGSY